MARMIGYDTKVYVKKRTKSEVLALRNGNPASGCCDRYFDHSPCTCLEDAEEDRGWAHTSDRVLILEQTVASLVNRLKTLEALLTTLTTEGVILP